MLWQSHRKDFFILFERHLTEVLSSGALLTQLFQQPATASLVAESIKACEHSADQIAHDIFRQINQTFILPFDREDIVSLISRQDDIIDFIDDTAEAYAEIYLLNSSNSTAENLTVLIIKALERIKKVLTLLSKPSLDVTLILHECIEIHYLESEGDRIKKEGLKELFQMLGAQKIFITEHIAWTEILRTLESVTDIIEDWANVAEQIAIKYS